MFIVVYCNHSYIYIQSKISFIIIGSMGVWWRGWARYFDGKAAEIGKNKFKVRKKEK